MSDALLRSLNCPNCGAPIEFPEARGTVKCRFCDSVIERSDEAPTAEDEGHALKVNIAEGRIAVERVGNYTQGAKRFVIKMQDGQPMVIESSEPTIRPPTFSSVTYTNAPPVTTRRTQSSGAGCWVWALVIGIVLLTVLPITAAFINVDAVMKSLTGGGTITDALTAVPTITSRFVVGRDAALIPSVNDAPPDLIFLADEYPQSGGDSVKRLVALSGERPQFLWKSAALDNDTYDTRILGDAERIYTVSGNRLLAFNRADGATAWEAALADKISFNICVDCFRLLDGRLFALSDDGSLSAFDAATGQPRWNFRATQDSPRGLYVLGSQIVFMDRDENSEGVMHVFDPASGERVTHKPLCTSDEFFGPKAADWTTPLYPAATGTDFFIIFGWPAPCIQRLDSKTIQPVWSTVPPRELNLLSSINPNLIVTADALFIAADDKILRVEAANGETQVLIQDGDYRFNLLDQHDGVLVLLGQRQRGTTRNEVWAVDAQSGERRWSVDLGEAPPFGGALGDGGIIDEDKPAWTWHASARGLHIVRFKRTEDDVSHAILHDVYDWQTGESGGQRETGLGVETIILSAPGFTLWRGETLWMEMETGVMAFDAADDAIVYRWP
ncbi:MAG: outer membrane protein assembly factor BamB family protein [Anaerolineales bacterium]